MSKIAMVGWGITLFGTLVWVYGYYTTGSPSIVDWRANAPAWIADYLPNKEAEIGMLMLCVGMIPIYWPRK
jgi:hypothetical protein